MPEIEPMVVIRPLDSMISGSEGLGHAVGAEDVDVHLELEVVLVDLDEGSDDGDPGVVDQSVETPAVLGDALDRGVDLLLNRDIETNRCDVFHGVEPLEIGLLSSAGPDVDPAFGKDLGDLEADPARCAGHQHGFLSGCRRFGFAGRARRP